MQTADSGYLTRRLVDVSQEVIVREEDCFAAAAVEPIRGMHVTELLSGKQSIESLEDRLRRPCGCRGHHRSGDRRGACPPKRD